MEKIWVIEDDESIRGELQKLLRANGYQPVEGQACDLVLLARIGRLLKRRERSVLTVRDLTHCRPFPDSGRRAHGSAGFGKFPDSHGDL